MSRRNKLLKFAELLTFPNVYENFDGKKPELVGLNGALVEMKGKWRSGHFKNSNPLVLELACGRGEYTLGLSRRFPEINFLGVDAKGARIWKGAGIALEENLDNAAFLRTKIELIHHFVDEKEVDEIWITFPDPFLKERKANRRLTSAQFLKHYKKILKPGAVIHLKTDDPTLYEYTLEVLAESKDYKLLFHENDIYSKPLIMEELELKTYYEKMHLANEKKIKYVRMQLKDNKD